ncbi:hypothetical protein FDUTEX481_01257 [Tolypothrix sp. PCC 7601]|nr:hypothetical protein FDUTEX481_01257 [Tolypothrix sp. PCC 7601]
MKKISKALHKSCNGIFTQNSALSPQRRKKTIMGFALLNG